MAPNMVSPAMPAHASHAGAVSPHAEVAPKLRSLRDGRLWRDAALVWLAQHLFFLLPIYLNIALAPPRPITPRGIGLPWLNWDGWIYVDIARHGYQTLNQAAFFPLYPLVTRLVAVGLGGHTALAALVVANAASFGAYGLLLALVEREFGRVAARRTLLFLLGFPAAFFLAAAYTESLFLLLSVGAFLALRRHAWLAAGVLAALATLTRPVGILLLLPLVAELARAVGVSRWLAARFGKGMGSERGRKSEAGTGGREAGRGAREAGARETGVHRAPLQGAPASKTTIARMGASVLLPVVALAGYCGYLALRFGRPLGFLSAEGGTWGRRASWPWDSFLRAGAAVLHDPLNQAIPAGMDLLLMALFIAVTVVAARRLPLPYALYALGSLVLIVLLPMHMQNWGALSSNKRFMVDVFPLFLALGTTRPRRWIEPLAVILTLLLQVLLAVAYLQRGWVA